MKHNGFLAIWCEIAPTDLADYRNWLTQEHIADRTFSPGFLGGRLFEELDNPCAHFILYATDGPEVLNGPEYRAILENPSPWTRRIMPKFGPFDRALGRQVAKIGNGFGSHVVVWRLRLTGDAMDLVPQISGFAGRDGVVSLRMDVLNHATTDRHSEEKTMRGGAEGDFDILLCAEAMSEAAATSVEVALSEHLNDASIGVEIVNSSVFAMFYGEAAHEGPMGA